MHVCILVCTRDARVCVDFNSGGRCAPQKCHIVATFKVTNSAIYDGETSELSRERFSCVPYLSVRQVVMNLS